MKVEAFQRKQINQKKEEEKQAVENDLYKDLENLEHKNQILSNGSGD